MLRSQIAQKSTFSRYHPIHLHSKFTADIGGHGDIQYIYIFSAVAAFVLIIACINFMNLSTARSTRRSKEVGIRKVVGAERTQLIRQFLIESIMFVLISLFVALVLTQLLLPSFNEISGKTPGVIICINAAHGSSFHSIMIVTRRNIRKLSGFIYVFFQAGYNLKGGCKVWQRRGNFPKSAGDHTIHHHRTADQRNNHCLSSASYFYPKQETFGSKKTMSSRSGSAMKYRKNLHRFKNELSSASGVSGVTYTSNSLTYVGSSGGGMEWEGEDSDVDILFHFLAVDYDFIKTFNIEMIDGRNFSREMATDSAAIIVNEEAIRQMGFGKSCSQKKLHGMTR